MPKIFTYQKITDDYTTYTANLRLADDVYGTELCTLNDVTYVSIPDSYSLPDQLPEVVLVEVALDTATKTLISKESPHIQLINQRVADAIAKQYTMQDEIKLIRTSPSTEFDAYNAYAEQCRSIGRDEKYALLG